MGESTSGLSTSSFAASASLGRTKWPAGAPVRKALVVSSDYPDAVELVTRFYNDLGFDAVDHSPVSGLWRRAPHPDKSQLDRFFAV